MKDPGTQVQVYDEMISHGFVLLLIHIVVITEPAKKEGRKVFVQVGERSWYASPGL